MEHGKITTLNEDQKRNISGREFLPFISKPINFDKDIGLQMAIDLSVEKGTRITFPCGMSNKEIRGSKQIKWKGCGAFGRESDEKNGKIDIYSQTIWD